MASSYFLFLTYFDLLRNRASLPNWRLLVYSLLHFPFHASLLLYSIGSATFIQWQHAVSTVHLVNSYTHPSNLRLQYESWMPLDDEINKAFENDTMFEPVFYDDYSAINSTVLSEVLKNETDKLLSNFSVQYAEQQRSIDEVFNIIKDIPDSFWFSNNFTNQEEVAGGIVGAVQASILNSVFVHFEVRKYGKVNETSTINCTDNASICLFKEQLKISDEYGTRAKALV